MKDKAVSVDSLEMVVALETNTPIVRQVRSADYEKGYDAGYHAGRRKSDTELHALILSRLPKKQAQTKYMGKRHSFIQGRNNTIEEVEQILADIFQRKEG